MSATSLQNRFEIDTDLSTGIKDMISEKGNTCISVIVPTHHLGQDRQGDRVEIERAISEAKQADLYDSGKLLDSLDELFLQIDYTHNKEGIGLFVSPAIKKLVKFPFPVTKKVVVDKSFRLQELLYVENYNVSYYLLDVSRKEIHLYRGLMDHLEEIREGIFPKTITEEYEYSKPTRGRSETGYADLKGFEKDKSILQQIRIKNIFQQADKVLSKYLVSDSIPLLLCGPEKDVSIFKSVSDHTDNIVTPIIDSYKGASIRDLESLAWEQMRSYLDDQKSKLIVDVKEKIGEGLAKTGIEEVWGAAQEGRGLILLVEKDFEKPAFITQDNKLSLREPGANVISRPDMVSEIISVVLEKKGNVIIFEKEKLVDYGRTALLLRY
jgi:hypothetical protein